MARAKVDAGGTLRAVAAEFDVHYGTLSRALGRKVVKQEKADVPAEEISVVNQLEGKLHIANDDNRVLRAQLKQMQTQNVTLKALGEQVRQHAQPIPPYDEMWKKRSKANVKESAVLHLSDGHHDSVILPHRCGGLEAHDFNIAMARGENLVDTVLDFTQTHMTYHQFETLWVLAYGDHTQGEIQGAVKHTHFGNCMRNCLAIGQFHAQMFRDLARWFPQVKVLYLSGNHGRRKEVAKKDYHASWDSWDYLIAETAAAYSADLWNVEFLIPDSFSAVIEIEGHPFCCFHGDDIKGWAGIPWYGIERKTMRLTALNSAHDRRVRYYCMGHFHAAASQMKLKGETFINGAWPACDPYSFNALDGCNEPMQWLHGVHETQGATWRLPCRLRRPEESQGPQRYKVSLAEPEGRRVSQ
jgi:UDP-2,3-diacylglucosamine pyrophosphatase LpxH